MLKLDDYEIDWYKNSAKDDIKNFFKEDVLEEPVDTE